MNLILLHCSTCAIESKWVVFPFIAVGGSSVPKLVENIEEDKLPVAAGNSRLIEEEDGDVSREPSPFRRI